MATDQSDKIGSLIAKRGQIKATVTRFQKYLDGSSVDPTILTRRLHDFEELPHKFEQIQGELEELDPNEIEGEERGNFEDRYYSLAGRADKILKSSSNVDSSVSVEARSAAGNSDSPWLLKLPGINLKKFSGSYDEWIPFYDNFIALIHNHEQLKDVQKLHYLKSSLVGKAEHFLDSLATSADNYSVALDLLKDKFDNKRLIIQRHVRSLFELAPINKESAIGLSIILEGFRKHLAALTSLKRPVNEWDDLLILLLCNKLDSVTVKEWEATLQRREIPRLDPLLEFIENKVQRLETSIHGGLVWKQDVKEGSKVSRDRIRAANLASMDPSCQFCSKNHTIQDCLDFLNLPVEVRMSKMKEKRLCLNCFKGNHSTYFCKSNLRCAKCKKRHNELLHMNNNPSPTGPVPQSPMPAQQTSRVHSVTQPGCNIDNESQVLLSTAQIKIRDCHGDWQNCRALLDSGSQVNLITSSFAKGLGLRFTRNNVQVTGINQVQSFANFVTEASISSRLFDEWSYDIDCVILNNITERVPSTTINIQGLSIPKNIKLADPAFNRSRDIDLLLGADVFWRAICDGRINGKGSQPTFQRTKFGWIVAGRIGTIASGPRKAFNLTIGNLEETVNKFWQVEEVSCPSSYTPEEKRCEKHFLDNLSRDNVGRFIVRLPFKHDPRILGDSKGLALKRFLNLERRLRGQPQLANKYKTFLKEYIDLGHMSLVDDIEETKPSYYMPHHCVLKEGSLTTELRVVFDASAKSTSGLSLNEVCMKGPTIQQTLFSILIRYRTHNFVLNADITKMYRQILVHENDTCFQRILWRFNPSEEVKTYALRTVTYGTVPASYLATRCLEEISNIEKNHFPVGASIVRRDFYMDDLLTGARSVEELRRIRNDVISVLNQAGFELRKFASNSREVIDDLKADSKNMVVDLDKDGSVKTLGLQWHAERDTFHFSIRIKPLLKSQLTKRSLLSEISKIFDPLGLLTPVTIKAKILLQKIWQLKMDWDVPLPSEIVRTWLDYIEQLPIVNQVNLDRRVIMFENPTFIELHGFCDASEAAYGACVYVRSGDDLGNCQSRVLCSKSRVAPLKSVSIPRLELCGAVLLIDLMLSVKLVWGIDACSVHYWTDSTIVLNWIRSESRKFNVFVGNRIGHIQNASSADQWRHVSTKENPADQISRGLDAKSFVEGDLWSHGPAWLSRNFADWPKQPDLNAASEEAKSELKGQPVVVAHVARENSFDLLFETQSSFNKLIGIVAYCWRFYHNCRAKLHDERQVGTLSFEEIIRSRNSLVKIVQEEEFATELNDLRRGKNVRKCSKTLPLSPFLDEQNILRVGGRLRNSGLPYDARHPILLPSKHPFTRMMIMQEHKNNLHAGYNTTLAAIRQNYWPIAIANDLKKLLRECAICARFRPNIPQPIMGDLPENRLKVGRPFSLSGVDYFGPFLIKEGGRRSRKIRKAYVAIFVCFVTRAVHLEVVSDLTTEAFVSALKRFMARRGKISEIYSDNGTNFVGAREKFSKLHKLNNLNIGEVTDALETPLKWHFIPSNSPHFGGLWEAAVKSAKSHMKRVAGASSLTFEEMSTLMTQIEAILNSRPLTPMSNDPNDPTFLTPAHFLIGDSLMNIVEPEITDMPINRLTRWQHVQQMYQHFWNRWSKEYLAQFHQRTKWKTNKGPALEVGQLVLLRQKLPPLHWKVGRVIAVHPGSDGVVRAITVRTGNGSELRRASNRLCVLPM